MTTRAILRARLQTDTEYNESAYDDRWNESIADAIAFYQRHRFYFNDSEIDPASVVSFNTVAATQVYSFNTPTTTGDIQAEFYRLDGVYLTDSGQRYDLDVANYNDILSRTNDTEPTGRPEEYGYAARSLILYSIPDDAYEVTLTGHIKFAAPVDDAETDNPWMTEAFELIRCAAKRFFAVHVISDDDMAAKAAPMEAIALASLTGATSDRVRTGHVEATDF